MISFSLLFFTSFLSSSSPSIADSLRVLTPVEPITLDTTGEASMNEAFILGMTQAGLMKHSEKGVVPHLAQSVSTSNDGKVYTFELKKGIRWSDGTPILASDFVFAWRRLAHPSNNSIYRAYLNNISGFSDFQKKPENPSLLKVYAKSKQTLVVELNEPEYRWEACTAFFPFFPLPEKLLQEKGKEYFKAGTYISSGPYVISSWTIGKSMKVVWNKHSIQPQPRFTDVEILFQSQTVSQKRDLKSESIDLIFPIAEKDKGYFLRAKFLTVNLPRVWIFGFNNEKFPSMNADFRKAIIQSIPFQKVFEELGISTKRILYGISPEKALSNPNFFPRYDLRLAQKSLERSGVLIRNELKLQFPVLQQTEEVELGMKIAEHIQKNLGIRTEVLKMNNAEYIQRQNMNEFHLMLYSWTQKVPKASDYFLPHQGTNSNRLKVKSDSFTEWFKLSSIQKTEAKFHDYLNEAQKIFIQEQMFGRPLFQADRTFAYSHRINKIIIDGFGNPAIWDFR